MPKISRFLRLNSSLVMAPSSQSSFNCLISSIAPRELAAEEAWDVIDSLCFALDGNTASGAAAT